MESLFVTFEVNVTAQNESTVLRKLEAWSRLQHKPSEGMVDIFWAALLDKINTALMPCAAGSTISKHGALHWAMNHKEGEVCRRRPLWTWMWWCGYSCAHVRLCGKHKEGQAESHGSSCSQRHDSPSRFNLSQTGPPSLQPASLTHVHTHTCARTHNGEKGNVSLLIKKSTKAKSLLVKFKYI